MEREDPKKLPGSFQQRRRAAALDHQKSARKQLTDRARKLALGAAEYEEGSESGASQQEDVEIQEASSSTPKAAAASPAVLSVPRPPQRSPGEVRRQYYADQLMLPEWLIEVPPDLGSEWYVLPRPEGPRCLVISARGQTVARLRNGVVLERFPSALPAGAPGQPAGDDAFCILDCVFHEANSTYYVQDMMCWKGYSLYHCSAEFRLFWVHSKLSETAAGGAPTPARPRRFAALPALRTTPDGLQAAHGGGMGAADSGEDFQRDGVLLLHKEGQYSPGQTPLALLWKDAACSRYLVDTDAAGVPLAQQHLVLEYRMDRTVATADDTPAVLGRMPESFVGQMGGRLRAGKLLRFKLGPSGIYWQEGQPVGADLHFDGPANQRRGRADSLSKIVFQHQARHAPIALEALLAAAAASAPESLGGDVSSGSSGGGGGGMLARFGSIASISVISEAAGGGSMAVDATDTDGIEVDS